MLAKIFDQTRICAASLFCTLLFFSPLYADSQLPEIGDPADRYLSINEEKTLGENFMQNVYRSGKIIQDPELANYIQHLGSKLTGSLGNNNFAFTFFIVDEPYINAFAVPGGYVGINAGLILASSNESELAGVVGHEVAHVSQRHIARRIADLSTTQIPTLGAILAGLLLAIGGAPDAGTALIYAGTAAQQQRFINFTRSNEIEADRIGLQILYQAGFDPNGMADFFRVLQQKRFSQVPEQFEYLMTHPLDNTRIAEAQNRIDRLPAQPYVSSSNYHLAKARLQALTSGKPKQLVEDLAKQNAATDPNPVLRYAYSQALEQANQPAAALEILTKLTAAEPEVIAYQLGYARAALLTDKTAIALTRLENLLQLYPDSFPVNYYYAKALQTAGQSAKASQNLRQYLQQYQAPTLTGQKLLAELYQDSGQTISAYQALAEYYFASGDLPAAAFQLEQALRDQTIDSIKRSQIEERLKQVKEAVQKQKELR